MAVQIRTVFRRDERGASRQPPGPAGAGCAASAVRQLATALGGEPQFVLAVSRGFSGDDGDLDAASRQQRLEALGGALREALPRVPILGVSSCLGAWADGMQFSEVSTSDLVLWGLRDPLPGASFGVGVQPYPQFGLTPDYALKAAANATRKALERCRLPKLAIFTAAPGLEEMAIQGLRQALVEHRGKEWAQSVCLYGITIAADTVGGSTKGWWLFGTSGDDSQAHVCANEPWGLGVALLGPTCSVQDDFYHPFNDADAQCWVAQVADHEGTRYSAPRPAHARDNPSLGTTMLSRLSSLSDIFTKQTSSTSWLSAGLYDSEAEDDKNLEAGSAPAEYPDCREICSVWAQDCRDGELAEVPAAIWFDKHTGNSISKQIVRAMEDGVGTKVMGAPSEYILMGKFAMSLLATLLQIPNAAYIGLECWKEDHTGEESGSMDGKACMYFKYHCFSLVGMLVLNTFATCMLFYRRWADKSLVRWRSESETIFSMVVFLGCLNSDVLRFVGSYIKVPFTRFRFPAFLDSRQQDRRLIDAVQIAAVFAHDVPQVCLQWLQFSASPRGLHRCSFALVATALNLAFKVVTSCFKLCRRNVDMEVQEHTHGLAITVLDRTAAFPIGRSLNTSEDPDIDAEVSLLHVAFVTPGAGLLLFANVRCGEHLMMMHASRRNLERLRPRGVPLDRGIKRCLVEAEERGMVVHGSLMSICGGQRMRMIQEDEQEGARSEDKLFSYLQASFGGVGGGFLCVFPFGEQGRPREDRLTSGNPGIKSSFLHGNLMSGVVVFASPGVDYDFSPYSEAAPHADEEEWSAKRSKGFADAASSGKQRAQAQAEGDSVGLLEKHQGQPKAEVSQSKGGSARAMVAFLRGPR